MWRIVRDFVTCAEFFTLNIYFVNILSKAGRGEGHRCSTRRRRRGRNLFNSDLHITANSKVMQRKKKVRQTELVGVITSQSCRSRFFADKTLRAFIFIAKCENLQWETLNLDGFWTNIIPLLGLFQSYWQFFTIINFYDEYLWRFQLIFRKIEIN